MSTSKDQIERSISLGNINPKILIEFFKDLKVRSYAFDYNMQKELVNYGEKKLDPTKGRSFLASGVFSSGYNRVIEFTIDYQFVVPGEKESYLKSDIFNSFMDFETLNQNKKYFRFVPLVFADNKILLNYRMQAYNERINLYFLDKEFDKSVNELTVLFIPDSIVTVIDVKNGYFSGTNINFSHFPSNKEFKKVKGFIGFWIHEETGVPYIITNVKKNQKNKYITVGTLLPTNVADYKLMLVGIDNLYSVTQIGKNEKWFEYEKMKMPISKDNNIILIKSDKNFYPNDGSVQLTEHYPNIYEITNPNKYEIMLITLYEDNSTNERIYYDHECKLYDESHDIRSEYEADTVPQALKEFAPLAWNYSVADYIKRKTYKDIKFNTEWDAFTYKMQNITFMLKHWALFYEEYQKRTYGFLHGWYHNLANYDDLESKVRNNVNEDIDDVGFDCSFKEPQYVFTYLKDASTGDANSFCFFIDGKYTIPTKTVVYRGIQYVYFPKRLFKADSVIEVERFDGNSFFRTVQFPKEDTIPVDSVIRSSTFIDNSVSIVINDEHYGDIQLNDLEVPVEPIETTFKSSFANGTFNNSNITKKSARVVFSDRTLGDIELNELEMSEPLKTVNIHDMFKATAITEDTVEINVYDHEKGSFRFKEVILPKSLQTVPISTLYKDSSFEFNLEDKPNAKVVVSDSTFGDVELTEIGLPKPSVGAEMSFKGILKSSTVANNLFLVSPMGEFVNNGEVLVYIIDKELGEVEVDLNKSVFIVEPDSKIKIVPVNYGYTKIMVCCNNATYQYYEKESGDDFLYGRDMTVNLNYRNSIQKVKQDISHRLRIFNDEGRLIPKSAYNVYKYTNFYASPKFNIPINYGTNETFTISYIGYDERLIYHKEEVPANGLIELEGKLSRPFNLAYHDLYLDGYKLTKYDIKIISPFSFAITSLAKFDTRSNLEIYERIHVPEPFIKFGWGEGSNYLADKLFKKNTAFYEEIIQSLENIEVSGEVKDIDTMRDWFFSFFNDYLPYNYMNPDYRYDLEAYHHIFDEDTGRIVMNPDDRVKYKKQVRTFYYMNHDKSIELYGEDLSTYPLSPMYIRDTDESVLVPSGTAIPEEIYARYGYTEEDYDRIYDTNFNLYNPIFIPTKRNDDELIYTKVVEGIETTEFRPEPDTSTQRYVYPN